MLSYSHSLIGPKLNVWYSLYINKRVHREGVINMANIEAKKDMIIDVQPLTTKKDVNGLIEALGMTKRVRFTQSTFVQTRDNNGA